MTTKRQKIIPPFWASSWGQDPYGAWVGLIYENIEQKFRWIKAGDFWMGSPNTEKERESNEIRNRVRIPQGFWLAETACTQALWQAIMGNNPSNFKSDNLPVENISWHDAKDFVKKLNSFAESLDFRLPTEAEWEYACRTETETPFSFGETIDAEQVNFNGNYPYAGSKKSKYRGEMVPVGSLPCNSWGLYEMHGNVWEWCEDWYGKYDIPKPDTIVIDPRGPNMGSGRVLRGGSWGNDAGRCRSAYRSWFRPGVRDDSIGFRLASGHQVKL